MGRKREMAMEGGVMRMPGGPEWLQVRARVELRSDEEGYAGAWFEVEIGGLFPQSNQAFVKYEHFVDEETGKAVQEFARVDNLRPLPPRLQQPARLWRPRDAVETYYKNAWWVGYIKARVAHHDSKYVVYYGKGEQDLEISGPHIRRRQNYAFPSSDNPKGSWSLARPMQNPAVWERIEAPPAAVAKIQLRRVPPSSGDESDGSWDEREEARRKRQKKKSASRSAEPKSASRSVEAKSASRSAEPARKIRFVSRPKALTITHALPAVGAKATAAEQQSTLVLTPGSSPPPFQDCTVSPGSDSKPPSSSPNASTSSSGNSSGSTSSNSDAEDEPPIFPDFSSSEERVRNREAYRQLLLCFRHDSKGMLDSQRHNILNAVRGELKLSSKDVNDAHCAVFGMPGM